MLSRVLGDLALVPGIELATCLHREQRRPAVAGLDIYRAQPTVRQAVMQLAANADQTLVIAPETDGILLEVCQWVLNAGGKLLGPDIEEIKIFSDKFATWQLLKQKSIPTTILPELPSSIGPFVVKPRWGAGAEHTALGMREQANAMMAAIRCQDYAGELIAQPYWPGQQASIAVIARPPKPAIVLPAVEQIIEPSLGTEHANEGASPAHSIHWFSYRGGKLPLPSCLDQRGRELARYVLDLVPTLKGYFGIDLILAPAQDGASDRIVEVNPRLTSSYTGYSQVFGGAVMGQLLLGETRFDDAALEQRIRGLWQQRRLLRFAPDGQSNWINDHTGY